MTKEKPNTGASGVPIFQIVITGAGDVDTTVSLWERIQNKYNLFDNCVLEADDEGDNKVIRIEGHVFGQVQNLMQRIIRDFQQTYNIIIEATPYENTIIDDDRRGETGELSILTPPDWKPYLVQYEIRDGEHEYAEREIVREKTAHKASMKWKRSAEESYGGKFQHDMGTGRSHIDCGERWIVYVGQMQELEEDEAKILESLGVA
jgi:hypothetical protein